MKYIFPLLLFSHIFLIEGCKTKGKENERIIIADTTSGEEANPDTSINGKFKFYDSLTNNLESEANYSKGVLHGENKEYYLNGVLKVDGYYRDGKKNGYVRFFDSTGTLLSKEYYYYGIPVGPFTDYKDNEPTEYSFNSLDNRPLFYINYDSIKGRNIEDLQKGYIYFDVYQKADVITKKNVRKEYRLYLISPPKFRFAYTLCIIKEKYQVVKEIKEFDNSKIWDTFETDRTQLALGETFAIRLFVDDYINQQALGMFKKID